MNRLNIQKIIREEVSTLSEKEKRKILHDLELEEASVTQKDVGKAYDELSKATQLLLINLKHYKAAKDDKERAKWKKAAGYFTKRKKRAEANLEKLIQSLDKDVELELSESEVSKLKNIVGEEFDKLNEWNEARYKHKREAKTCERARET